MKYLVHIGYPKAASTFLQKNLFSGSHPDIKPLGYEKSGDDIYKPGKDLFFQIYEPHKAGKMIKTLAPFTFEKEAVKAEIDRKTHSDCKINCLSNETWAGHPLSGGARSKLYADRIHSVLPKAKILIIIRKQEDMLLSMYADALERFYKSVSFEDFLFLPQQDLIPAPTPYYFCFDGLASYYMKLFGEKNVLILPFELLKEKGDTFFMNEICDFLGVSQVQEKDNYRPENARRYKDYALFKALRHINSFSTKQPSLERDSAYIPLLRPFLINLLRPFFKGSTEQREQDLALAKEYLKGFVEESNKKLQARMKYNLSELGYNIKS